jgi:hypothetical protein
MSSGTIVAIIIVVVVVAAVVIAGALTMRRRRLQQRFGPEYDRAVERADSRHEAEAELAEREKRVRGLDIRPLDPAARDRYASQWMAVQEQFVDSPAHSVTSGQALITAVMAERGYPTEDPDQIEADLSVEHAATIDQFRTAQELSGRAAAGTASTEDLRLAMVHYRTLFRDLLGEADSPTADTTVPDPVPDTADGTPVTAARPETTGGPETTGKTGTIGTDTMPASSVPADAGPDYAVQDFDYPAPQEPAGETAPDTEPAAAGRHMRRR